MLPECLFGGVELSFACVHGFSILFKPLFLPLHSSLFFLTESLFRVRLLLLKLFRKPDDIERFVIIALLEFCRPSVQVVKCLSWLNTKNLAYFENFLDIDIIVTLLLVLKVATGRHNVFELNLNSRLFASYRHLFELEEL